MDTSKPVSAGYYEDSLILLGKGVEEKWNESQYRQDKCSVREIDFS